MNKTCPPTPSHLVPAPSVSSSPSCAPWRCATWLCRSRRHCGWTPGGWLGHLRAGPPRSVPQKLGLWSQGEKKKGEEVFGMIKWIPWSLIRAGWSWLLKKKTKESRSPHSGNKKSFFCLRNIFHQLTWTQNRNLCIFFYFKISEHELPLAKNKKWILLSRQVQSPLNVLEHAGQFLWICCILKTFERVRSRILHYYYYDIQRFGISDFNTWYLQLDVFLFESTHFSNKRKILEHVTSRCFLLLRWCLLDWLLKHKPVDSNKRCCWSCAHQPGGTLN